MKIVFIKFQNKTSKLLFTEKVIYALNLKKILSKSSYKNKKRKAKVRLSIAFLKGQALRVLLKKSPHLMRHSLKVECNLFCRIQVVFF
jgi:hypothetical protein